MDFFGGYEFSCWKEVGEGRLVGGTGEQRGGSSCHGRSAIIIKFFWEQQPTKHSQQNTDIWAREV
jgi:hypothetical protein